MAKVGKGDVLAAGGKRASFSVPKVTQEAWDRAFRGVPLRPKRAKSKPLVWAGLDVLMVPIRGPNIRTGKKS